VTSPLIDAILAYLATAPAQASAASRPGVADLAMAIRDSHHGGDGALARALFEQLSQHLRR
jgi:hypothetical protein